MDGMPFGRYRLIELLGRGGMGEVWRAYDTAANNRTVAIKLLPPHLAGDSTFVQRFRREADAAAQLNNPHIIPIHNYGEIDGRLYVDMRLIEGHDLHEVLADGPMEPGRAVRIIEQVAKALQAAHRIGLVHRDVKPSNILVDEDDFAYLIDFGIARAADQTRMTGTGNIIGSWHYMSPERLRDGQIDARSDIYALACVLYECLTGSAPYPGDNFEQQITAHLTEPPPRPSSTDPNMPLGLDPVIATGMAKDPDQRYATTVELANAARDAITQPIAQPAPAPTLLSATEQAPLPPTEQAHNLVTAQPVTAKDESLAPARSAPPPPAPPTPTRAGGISRRTAIALIAGAIAVVAVIVAAIGISALGKHGPSQSSPASSAPPTSSERSYRAQIELPFAGANRPSGVAVDTAGNLYVIDETRVLKLSAGASTLEVLPFTGLNKPLGVAVDSAGDLYVTNTAMVLKLPAGSSQSTVLPFTNIGFLLGLAVDTTGNLYVTDNANNQLFKLAAGSSSPTVLASNGLGNPAGVAVDTTGTVYITDNGNNRVLKLTAGSSTPSVLPFTGLNQPQSVAVDTAGNLYVSDDQNNRVLKLAAGSSNPSVLPFTGLNGPTGVAVDTAGNIYVADKQNNRVLKLPVQ
jgi:serine/threonine protein kinase, bacterial